MATLLCKVSPRKRAAAGADRDVDRGDGQGSLPIRIQRTLKNHHGTASAEIQHVLKKFTMLTG